MVPHDLCRTSLAELFSTIAYALLDLDTATIFYLAVYNVWEMSTLGVEPQYLGQRVYMC